MTTKQMWNNWNYRKQCSHVCGKENLKENDGSYKIIYKK